MRLIEGRSFYKEEWYGSYHSMMDRCYREKSANYRFYGGRGIRVCAEWHNIENFEKWCMKSGYRKGLSLDRVNPNGDYCPDNCHWVTSKQQANNRRNTVYLTHAGETHTISEWAAITGICRSTISNRIYRLGWDASKALTKEVV